MNKLHQEHIQLSGNSTSTTGSWKKIIFKSVICTKLTFEELSWFDQRDLSSSSIDHLAVLTNSTDFHSVVVAFNFLWDILPVTWKLLVCGVATFQILALNFILKCVPASRSFPLSNSWTFQRLQLQKRQVKKPPNFFYPYANFIPRWPPGPSPLHG